MAAAATDNPYASPQHEGPNITAVPELEFVGFWLRVVAALIDTVIILLITSPILIAVYGWKYFAGEKFIQGPVDLLVSWFFPAVATICLWLFVQATPGKMIIGAKVVDATTGQPASTWQYVVRYLGYFVSAIPLMLGIVWIAFDRSKQGWHDKIAGTVVVRPTNVVRPENAHFPPQ